MYVRFKKLLQVHIIPGFCMVLASALFSAYAGDMGVPVEDRAQGFYGAGFVTHNVFHFNRAETASYFSPVAIEAPAATIEDRWGYAIGAGYRFNTFFRADLRIHYIPSAPFWITDDAYETARGHIDTYAAMLNGYVSYPLLAERRIEPYLGGGLGMARVKTNTIYWPLAQQHESGFAHTGFAWQLGAGGIYRITDYIDFDLYYSHLAVGRSSNSGQFDAVAANGVPAIGAPTQFLQLSSNQLNIGFHYRLE